jgi:2-polyprenyl-3-methyl-5-hydroxy-6-metoxy-1,4-benzoquinol methylase
MALPCVASLAEQGRILETLSDSDNFDIVVFDQLKTKETVFRAVSPRASLCIGIDEGGSLRATLPYLIDTLPGPPKRTNPNLFSIGFLDLPAPVFSTSSVSAPVLLTFGGEDPAGLAPVLARHLVSRDLFRPDEITVALGPAAKDSDFPPGIGVRRFGGGLRDALSGYRTVFTSFGITPFEALRSGCRVILFNPTRYHRLLSRVSGFPEVGVGRVDHDLLLHALRRPWQPERDPQLVRFLTEPDRPLGAFLRSLDVPRSTACPVCGTAGNRVIAREERRSFFRCGSCGIIYQTLFEKRGSSYTREYFFEEYRNQYGRTYLEDYETIRGYARPRLRRIGETVVAGLSAGAAVGTGTPPPARKASLLDIGCAYGPFLAEAAEWGYEPFGVDVSEDAVRYVRETLGISAVCGDFLALSEPGSDALFGGRRFDVAAMWYVIEHFEKPAILLERLGAVVRPGGVFSFSTPNSRGVSGRKDILRFCLSSPKDHHTIWDPRCARRILRDFGFSVRRVVVTGHHPERFPVIGKSRSSLVIGAVRAMSVLLGLGDTFEAYCRFSGQSRRATTGKG